MGAISALNFGGSPFHQPACHRLHAGVGVGVGDGVGEGGELVKFSLSPDTALPGAKGGFEGRYGLLGAEPQLADEALGPA